MFTTSLYIYKVPQYPEIILVVKKLDGDFIGELKVHEFGVRKASSLAIPKSSSISGLLNEASTILQQRGILITASDFEV